MKDEYKEYLLNFILQCNSLKDLLDILQNICNNLDLDYLNPQIKHFRYFQFTFFGLMAKAKNLLEMMIFKAEFINKNIIDISEDYQNLIILRGKLERAYSYVKTKKMKDGKNKIIELGEEYTPIFNKIIKLKKHL